MAFSREFLHWWGDKKLSLPNIWSTYCSWGCRNHSYKGAVLSTKLMESLSWPPSKEVVPQHMLTSQWIQTAPDVKKDLRTQIMNEDVVPWEQFCSLDKGNRSSVTQGREEHNQPSICSTDTQHINWLIPHCVFLDVIQREQQGHQRMPLLTVVNKQQFINHSQ